MIAALAVAALSAVIPATTPPKPGAVLFLGDSITALWQGPGNTTWNTDFVPLGAVDRGVIGLTSAGLWGYMHDPRPSTGMFGATLQPAFKPAKQPRTIVVNIGTNDDGTLTPEQSAWTVGEDLNYLHQRFPRAVIVDEQVLPRDAWTAEEDRLLAAAYGAFPDGAGFDPVSMTVDGVHPNAAGYAYLAGPYLASMGLK